jgi:hypothetical protein
MTYWPCYRRCNSDPQPISTPVGNLKNNDPSLIEPIAA